MNKKYLPYYNSLNEKEKTFWLDCSKEELIDHFIANVKNGEVLLNRIDEAIEYINKTQMPEGYKKMLLIILGDKENEET